MTRSLYRPPWRIDLTVRDGVHLPIAAGKLAGLAGRALTAAGAPSSASLGLFLTDDDELADLNAEHMGKSEPTDVLSFPLLPPGAFPPHPGHGPALAADTPTFPLPPGRRPHLGDIVVSVERAVEQAETGRGGHSGDLRWSAADELRLLVTHGVLHICGWDHSEPDEEAAMRALERRLLGTTDPR